MIKICVCTSYPAIAEPRAPKHAVALATNIPGSIVIFIDCIPLGMDRVTPLVFEGINNLTYITCNYPHRNSGLIKLVQAKANQLVSKICYRYFNRLCSSLLSIRAKSLEKVINNVDADIYYAHNIDTLLPVYNVATRSNKKLVFDSMEFHSDMGDSQTALESEVTRKIESKCLPVCQLVTTSSDNVAEELKSIYFLSNVLPLYNVPFTQEILSHKAVGGFSLYWRNSTIGLGQRGLGDILEALCLIPPDIKLNIQGRMPVDGGSQLYNLIESLGLKDRVVIHPPCLPHEAVLMASKYSVGLCPEIATSQNQRLTVSNKMFDYFMAGLPVISSDLPGLRAVIERSNAGITFKSGDVRDLADRIVWLYSNPIIMSNLSQNARSFALATANAEIELKKLVDVFKTTFSC